MMEPAFIVALVLTYVGVTFLAPWVLARPALVSAHPRLVLNLWMLALLISLTSLTLALGALVARALRHHVEHVADHGWLGPTIDTMLGWAAIAVFGLMTFRLGVAAQELRADTHARNLRLLLLVKGAEPTTVGRHTVLLVESSLHVLGAMPLRRQVLLTSGLHDALTPQELEAAVEHEQTHLREHHEVLRGIGQLAVAVAPIFPASRRMAQATRIATELIADDVAYRFSAKKYGPYVLANALLAAFPHNPDISERVARLRQRSREEGPQ
jgi:Zn-dependent protease with chaperone function